MIQNLIQSMCQRCNECIQPAGAHNCYLVCPLPSFWSLNTLNNHLTVCVIFSSDPRLVYGLLVNFKAVTGRFWMIHMKIQGIRFHNLIMFPDKSSTKSYHDIGTKLNGKGTSGFQFISMIYLLRQPMKENWGTCECRNLRTIAWAKFSWFSSTGHYRHL